VTIYAAIGIYFVLWWIVLFAVLPWGVRGLHEAGEVEDGNDPGAPQTPWLLRKAIATSLISAVLFAAVYFFWEEALVLIDRLPPPIGGARE
jgi:predicted secreted protein